LLLIVTATTGVSYRWARNIFGMEKERVSWLMSIHDGSFFSSSANASVFFTLVNASLLLFLISTGYSMIKRFWIFDVVHWGTDTKQPQSYRELHQKLSNIAVFILTLSAVTGFAYRWGETIFGFDHESVSWLMVLHQGSYWRGSEVLYTFVAAATTISMALSGLSMVPWVRNGFCWTQNTSVQL